MRNLKTTYIIALTIIGLVISVSQYLIQSSIKKGEVDSRTINISGRQRMLSQKITKASLAMLNASDQDQFQKRKDELSAAVEIWTKSHNGLQYGDASLKLIDVNNSDNILSLFEEITPYYDRIKGATQELLRYREFEEAKDGFFGENVQVILDNEASFLKFMNDITFEYDAEATSRISSLSKEELVLFLIAISLLFLEAILVFRPAVKKLEDSTRQILDKSKSLEISLKNEQYLTNQSKSVFENVKQGLLLLDKDLIISELYSKEVDNILEAENLAGTNFIKLFKTRLVGRDLESLEMFVENLFDPTIKESVVNKLNPVEQVEIFTSNSDPNLRKRYIKINFSRIVKDGEIFRVLVTIQDETSFILMQKQIEETKERNKEETHQLMAILKVNPKLLKNFLDQSIPSLQNISHLYENHEDKNYRSLISQTFNTVHSVKGNASLLELKVVEEQLHKIEDDLFALREKLDVEGKDFLSVLFKVTEVVSTLNNMDEILQKMAQIYKMIESGQTKEESNKLLKEIIESSAFKIGKELNKSVSVDFDANSIALPEEYKLDVKDTLVQLIRNSLVHGIESEEVRLSSGKAATGKILCGIYEGENGELILHYEDDGRGLDAATISQKALEKRIVDEDALKLMSQAEIYNLIFKESFSTETEVNMHAGRGQGLTLVKNIADRHRAEIKLDVIPGKKFKLGLIWK